MRTPILLIFLVFGILTFTSCKKEDDKPSDTNPDVAQVHFKFKFDPTQQRLNNFGQPATMPSANAAQNPVFRSMSAHYVELTEGPLVQLGDGQVLYQNEETNAGGATAIDFSKSIVVPEDSIFLSVPITDINPGTYEYLRVSLAYQNFDVQFDADVPPLGNRTYTGTLASFVGYNTYIASHKVKDSTITVNDDKLQGYWAFETIYQLQTGQAPGTTVPNPISSTSPIPPGSCVVTGPFNSGPLEITGNETEDITIVVSLSTNNSFEWVDGNNNGKWDPLLGETVVDMGLRGLVPIVE